jgi:Mn-dependent DtxR family transcriptional regulator
LAAKKNKKKMTAHQLSKDLSVRQIAAIVKLLSRKKKNKLLELIWSDMYDLTEEEKRIVDERIRLTEGKPGQIVPFADVKSLRLKK